MMPMVSGVARMAALFGLAAIAVAVGDDGAGDGADRIDKEVAGRAIEPFGAGNSQDEGCGAINQFRSRGISSSKSRAKTSWSLHRLRSAP